MVTRFALESKSRGEVSSIRLFYERGNEKEKMQDGEKLTVMHGTEPGVALNVVYVIHPSDCLGEEIVTNEIVVALAAAVEVLG
jgi:hypothetical protein